MIPENNPYYKALQELIGKSCTCEVIATIADICRKKAKALCNDNDISVEDREVLKKYYTEYADYLENFVEVADLPCPSQAEEDILYPIQTVSKISV